MPTSLRIPPETRQEARRRVEKALAVFSSPLHTDTAQTAVDVATEVLWAKLLGDARDRVATLIEAADAYLHATEKGGAKRPASDIAVKRRQLKRALAMLEEEK